MSTTPEFPDLFSAHSADYARYRPTYPPELFEWVASLCERRSVAWDCATGNGQALEGLSRWFDFTVGTDASHAQLGEAPRGDRVGLACAPVEGRVIANGAVDCITVAQALHWFDRDRFYEVVREVARSRGVIAAWTYAASRVCPAVDRVVREYDELLHRGYWSAERRHVDEQYASIEFPFSEVRAPEFVLRASWTLEQYRGYVLTWSASRIYTRREGEGAVLEWMDRLANAWGSVSRREVVWPLAVRAGHVHPLTT